MVLKSNKLGLLTTKIGSGVTPRGGQSVYQNSGINLIRSQNIYNDKFEKNGLVCISQEIAKKMKSVEIMKEDVLINITGDSVARVHIVPDEVLPARVNQHVCILRTNPELNPHYLYYFLINPETQNYLLSIAGIGGTRNALTKEMLYNLIIEYPDYPTQEKIVKQLNDIKNKIISLETQNTILEQIAKAIFKSWFVDFDGVTEFEDSELGKIPKGWEMKRLDELFKIYAGGDLSKISFSKNKSEEYRYPVYSNSLNDKGLYGFSKEYQYEPECVTITARGEVGRAEYRTDFFNAIVRLLVLKPKYDFICSYSTFFINSKLDFSHVGSAVNQLTAPAISDREIILPSPKLLERFEGKISSLQNKINFNSTNIFTLKQIRNALLPKLMSGEIRV